MTLKIVALYGSVRSDRKGIRFARFLERMFEERGHDITLIDPCDFKLPMLDKMYKEFREGESLEPLQKLAELIRPADGFLIVSGEYNHGIPPALKNMLDHFLEEWFWRPSAIASYSSGHFGGVRAALQLRSTLAELGMPSIPSILPMPNVQDQFDEHGVPHNPALEAHGERFFDEFEWYARALKAARAGGVPC